MWRILVAEDDPRFAAALRDEVATRLAARAEFEFVGDVASARTRLAAERPDLLILDAVMPLTPGGAPDRGAGVKLLGELPTVAPGLPAVMLSGQDRRDAVQLMLSRRLAGYLFKDYGFPEIRAHLEALLDRLELARSHRLLRDGVARGGAPAVIGTAPAFQAAVAKVEQAAATDTSVLLTGESGTGKEVLARHLHVRSKRADGPFVALSCAAIPEGLAEAELFGARKGAYTGLDADREGALAQARGGTLFLDEVGELPVALQPKLLRALQERVFRPLGATREEHSDFRLVCATHRDLGSMVREGKFRDDLRYRIAVFPVELPPLRARREDIPLLVEHLVARFAREMGRPLRGASPPALAVLMAQPWPGNVRELVNAIEYAFVVETTDRIQVESLPRPAGGPPGADPLLAAAIGYDVAMEGFERRLIGEALGRNGSHLGRTAEALGIPRRTLQNRMAKLGIRIRGVDADPPEA